MTQQTALKCDQIFNRMQPLHELTKEWQMNYCNRNKLDAWQCPAWWLPVGWVRTPVVFCRLWTKVHRIKFACAGVSIVCNIFFRMMTSCIILEIFAIKSRSYAKSFRNFDVFVPPNFGRPPKFLTEFYKCGSPSNMWQSLVMIGQATSEIRRQQKRILKKI